MTTNNQPPDDLRVLEEHPKGRENYTFDVHSKSWPGAVLLADEIKLLCEDPTPFKLIQPFKPEKLRPASYQLTLGSDAHIGGESVQLEPQGSKTPTILQPHQVAVVSTAETIRIPRFLIARWSLRVTVIYEGLLWTGGPQVDPGWAGRLYCPIYNLSEKPFILYPGKELFTIDFVRTTSLSEEYFALHANLPETWFTPKRRSLEDHDKYRLHSAPYEALADVKKMRAELNTGLQEAKNESKDNADKTSSFVDRTNGLIGVMFTVITLIVGIVTIFFSTSIFTKDTSLQDFLPNKYSVLLFTSLIAIFISALAVVWVWKLNRRISTGIPNSKK